MSRAHALAPAHALNARQTCQASAPKMRRPAAAPPLRWLACLLVGLLVATQAAPVAYGFTGFECEAKDTTGPGDASCPLFYYDEDGPESLVYTSSAPGHNVVGVDGVFVVGGFEADEDGNIEGRTNTVWFVPGFGSASDEVGVREWEEVKDPEGLPPVAEHALVAPTPDVLLVIGGSTGQAATSLKHVLRSTDGGETWAVVNARGGGFTGRRAAGAACVDVDGVPSCFVVGGLGAGPVDLVDVQVYVSSLKAARLSGQLSRLTTCCSPTCVRAFALCRSTTDMGATWTTAPGSPPFAARHDLLVAGRGSSVYVIGGVAGVPGSGPPQHFSDAYRYDAQSGTWTTLSSDSPHFSRGGGAAVEVGGTIFFGFGLQPKQVRAMPCHARVPLLVRSC